MGAIFCFLLGARVGQVQGEHVEVDSSEVVAVVVLVVVVAVVVVISVVVVVLLVVDVVVELIAVLEGGPAF